MARVLVVGAGFGGIVAAERLAKMLRPEHQITLVSRDARFLFSPSLVRLAFGECEPDDIAFDVREAMLSRRVRFVQAEVVRVDPHEREVTVAHGEVEGRMPYDYLVFALGRRLATERVKGFFEHADHLLTVEAALKFGERMRNFKEGRALIGYCAGARLPVPVFETAFALASRLEERGTRAGAWLTIVSPEPPPYMLGGEEMSRALRDALDKHYINFLSDFPISEVTPTDVATSSGARQRYDLLMLLPPFHGPAAVQGAGITDAAGFIRVDKRMRVEGAEGMYAVGDCVNFAGPKMGHMAVLQAEVAADNVAAEIERREPVATYSHELTLVIDEGGRDSIYFHKGSTPGSKATVRQGRFWGWAKWVHEKYWEGVHA